MPEFVDMFRDSLALVSKALRPALFERSVSQVGLEAKRGEDSLYSLSAEKCACPPSIQWRRMANTIVRLDEENLPVIIAYGVPELFGPEPHSLEHILDGAVLGNYVIYPILFGTVCWLYHFEGKWRLATKRSVDTSSTVLRAGGPSVGEAFRECVEKTLTAEERRKKIDAASTTYSSFLASLAVDRTYGFVLHDRRMHLYGYEGFESKIWHVSTISNDSGLNAGRQCGLPPPPVIFKTILSRFPVEGGEKIKVIVVTAGEERKEVGQIDGALIPRDAKTLPDTLRSNEVIRQLRDRVIEICKASAQSMTASSSRSNFGFILRSFRPELVFPDEHIIVKSPLYSFVERYIGKIIPIRRVVGEMLYSSSAEIETFFRYFPQFLPLYRRAEKEVGALAEAIVSYHFDAIAQGRLVDLHATMIQRLHASVSDSTPFDAASVKRTLLRPEGKAHSLVIDCLISLLPTEEQGSATVDFPILK